MRNEIINADGILNKCVQGFHRYDLETPAHPDFVSDNLCDMIGYSQEEILKGGKDAYAEIVHPEDREMYLVFIQSLSTQERRSTIQYRLIHKSGRIFTVQDTMTSVREEGMMRGYSTLADVTEIKKENEALHSINETVPCGILKYTCAETPRVTYINEQMLRIFRFDPKAEECGKQLAQYSQNIYLMIPPEERMRFKRFLDGVYMDDKPVAGEMTAMRCDGTRVRLYGWIHKVVNDDGEEEFQSVCMDVTDRYDRKRRQVEKSYLQALSQVYDEISEIDFSKKSIRFLQGRYCDRLGRMAQMPMVLEDTAKFWIEQVVCEEDREKVAAAFDMMIREQLRGGEDYPLQLEFRVCYSDQTVQNYIGIFLNTHGSNYLFCCRNISRQKESEALKVENTELRDITDQMRKLVMHFTDGMLAFEIRNDCVRPLYMSSNVRRFFGYEEEEWLASMKSMTPIKKFVSKCHISYEAFLELLENREAEFNYTDVATGEIHRIKAIRTVRTDGDEQTSYVMLYDITGGKSAGGAAGESTRDEAPGVYIRTFGYFDVFINGTPIAFRNEKAKELFALLVDRRGGFITSNEAISVLWEDEPANAVTLARYRKVALRLKNTLEEYGIAGVVESIDGKRRVVTQTVKCDLYDYLSGEPQYVQLFKGNYLQNYSWGETTLAELSNPPGYTRF